MSKLITRRSILGGLAVGAGGLLTGCDAVTQSDIGKAALMRGEDFHRVLQRTLLTRKSLAPEYRPDQMSPYFRTNGNRTANTSEYQALAADKFVDWRLKVDGLVQRPLSISLAQIQALPQRAQITRHDCVEGWSAIGKWQGPRLATILDFAGLRDSAKYIVFHCADRFGGTPYYESTDLVDAFHPQTILAWAMNDTILPTGHGAPLRLRVERQLGYKQAKFLMRIQAVDSLDRIGRGLGGYWEDVAAYDWYAGI